MKTKIVPENPEVKEIDWDTPMVVKHTGKDFYLLTNGEHENTYFTASVLTQGHELNNSPLSFGTLWLKKWFAPITEPITIKFIP